MDKQGFHLKWPRVVSERVDQFTERGARVRPDRGEVVAALLCSKEWSAPEIEEAVLAYRRMTAREVVLGVEADAEVVTVARHRPGRRAGRS